MAEKIRNCCRRRSDGGHNVGCNVNLNVVFRDIDLRSSDVVSSCSSEASRRGTVAVSVQVVAASSLTAQGFSASNEVKK